MDSRVRRVTGALVNESREGEGGGCRGRKSVDNGDGVEQDSNGIDAEGNDFGKERRNGKRAENDSDPPLVIRWVCRQQSIDHEWFGEILLSEIGRGSELPHSIEA